MAKLAQETFFLEFIAKELGEPFIQKLKVTQYSEI